MWTSKNRRRYDRSRLRYPSDLTDDEWKLVEPLIPPGKTGGGKRTVIVREVVNGLMYILSTGCQWRAIPKDLAAKSTVKKRHILVDTLGLLLHAIVHPADVQDRDGGILVMASLAGMFPRLEKLFADGGYQGPQFANAVAKVRPHLNVEIVKRSDPISRFVVLPKRWIVERTIAWLNRCRRLAKDWENL